MTPEELATAESKDLASEEKKREREEAQKQHMAARRNDYLLEELKKNCTPGMFVCKKCKSNKTTYYPLQTRGADEPMTNFVSCLGCGHQWKS